jgi:protein O-GlcNAc transferase
MTFSLAQMLGRACPRIDIVDVGAMALGDKPDYAAILATGQCNVVGFEPVQAECDKLNAMKHKDHTYLPYFIGDGTEQTFHLTNFSMTSSLYKPNARLLAHFNQLLELTTVVDTFKVQTKRLDDIPEISNLDMLKIDIQGAEYDCFRGANRLLSDALLIWTEVEFVQMYENQPLFAEVDIELRRCNMMFHNFISLSGRAFKPVMPSEGVHAYIRQQLWSDVIYLRNIMTIDELSEEKMLKLAVLSHDLLSSFDYTQLVLQHYDRKFKKNLWKVYMRRLVNGDPGEPTLGKD